MRKLFLIGAVLVVCLGLVMTSSYSAKPRNSFTPAVTASSQNPELDFLLVNQTGYAIKAVSIGKSGSGDWVKEDEVLKGRPFPNGKEYKIQFKAREKAEKWDIMVTWADDNTSEEWLELKLTEIDKVTLKYDKEKDKTWAIIE